MPIVVQLSTFTPNSLSPINAFVTKSVELCPLSRHIILNKIAKIIVSIEIIVAYFVTNNRLAHEDSFVSTFLSNLHIIRDLL